MCLHTLENKNMKNYKAITLPQVVAFFVCSFLLCKSIERKEYGSRKKFFEINVGYREKMNECHF